VKSEYKDQAELFDILWSESRVENILRASWDEISANAVRLADDIDKTLKILSELDEVASRRKFIENLPGELLDCMIIELVREIKDSNKITSGSSNMRGEIH